MQIIEDEISIEGGIELTVSPKDGKDGDAVDVAILALLIERDGCGLEFQNL